MPYFDDDGNEIDPSAIPMPRMCLICDKKDDPYEEILCDLNRIDQMGVPVFQCGAFVSLYGPLVDDIIE